MNQPQLTYEMEQLLRLRINRIRAVKKKLSPNSLQYKEFMVSLLHTQFQLEERYCSDGSRRGSISSSVSRFAAWELLCPDKQLCEPFLSF